MRDPQRIDPVIDALRAAWKRQPDMRLGQLIQAVAYSDPRDPYYLEDDVWLDLIDKHAREGQ